VSIAHSNRNEHVGNLGRRTMLSFLRDRDRTTEGHLLTYLDRGIYRRDNLFWSWP